MLRSRLGKQSRGDGRFSLLDRLLSSRSPRRFADLSPLDLLHQDMPDVAADLGISLDIVHLTISVFVFGQYPSFLPFDSPAETDTPSPPVLPFRSPGFGIGPLFFAPLSEVYGRRPIIIVSMGLYFGELYSQKTTVGKRERGTYRLRRSSSQSLHLPLGFC